MLASDIKINLVSYLLLYYNVTAYGEEHVDLYWLWFCHLDSILSKVVVINIKELWIRPFSNNLFQKEKRRHDNMPLYVVN